MTPERAQTFLRREVGDSKLVVRFDNRIQRFVVGRKLDSHVEDFYVVTDGESGYRDIDMRTVRKVLSLDTWRRDKTLSVSDFISKIEQQKLDRDKKRSEVIKYRLKHEARYIKKAARQDGVI